MDEESPFKQNHCICSSCKSPFPKSWFQTRSAVKAKGQDFCCQGCADRLLGVATPANSAHTNPSPRLKQTELL